MRLIDANKLCKLARNNVDGTVDCNDIMRFPTIDAVPVVHGYDTSGGMSLFTCSVCGWHCWDTYCGDTDTYNYCPNCGARMDGKEQTDEWVLEKIQEAHIVEAIPAEEGEWIRSSPFTDTMECSLCGYNIYSEEIETPHCPWCGARLKGKYDNGTDD